MLVLKSSELCKPTDFELGLWWLTIPSKGIHSTVSPKKERTRGKISMSVMMMPISGSGWVGGLTAGNIVNTTSIQLQQLVFYNS